MNDEERDAPTANEGEAPGYLQAQKVEIKYVYARFHRRVFANLIDFIIFALVFVGLFLGARAITMATPAYQENDTALTNTKLDSGLYRRYLDSGKTDDVVSFLMNPVNDFTGYAKMVQAREAIDTFIDYLDVNVGAEAAKKVQDDYDGYRLDAQLTYESVPYFVQTDRGIAHNVDCAAKAEDYFLHAYAPFIDEHCQGYLLTLVPNYLERVRAESNYLIYAELLPAYALAPLFAYLLPMMIFRRGRMTFGKALYHIGVVDKDLLVPGIGRSLARFGIFYAAELLLAPLTFAIPFLVSASLMAFTKAHQAFPDYMLGLYEVDASNDKLYFSREEILLSEVGRKKGPDFKPRYED